MTSSQTTVANKNSKILGPLPQTSGWIFEPVHGMGGADGSAYCNTLQGAGTPSIRLVREVIQNSTDAEVSSDTKVVVKFRLKRVKDGERDSFLSVSQISNFFSERKGKLGFDNSNALSVANNANKTLGLLYIEDYNTTGLLGELSDSHSNFHRLLLSLGNEQKVFDEMHSGGSYGYGKSVLSSNSRIRTIFAYSLAKEKNEKNPPNY